MKPNANAAAAPPDVVWTNVRVFVSAATTTTTTMTSTAAYVASYNNFISQLTLILDKSATYRIITLWCTCIMTRARWLSRSSQLFSTRLKTNKNYLSQCLSRGHLTRRRFLVDETRVRILSIPHSNLLCYYYSDFNTLIGFLG